MFSIALTLSRNGDKHARFRSIIHHGKGTQRSGDGINQLVTILNHGGSDPGATGPERYYKITTTFP